MIEIITLGIVIVILLALVAGFLWLYRIHKKQRKFQKQWKQFRKHLTSQLLGLLDGQGKMQRQHAEGIVQLREENVERDAFLRHALTQQTEAILKFVQNPEAIPQETMEQPFVKMSERLAEPPLARARADGLRKHAERKFHMGDISADEAESAGVDLSKQPPTQEEIKNQQSQ